MFAWILLSLLFCIAGSWRPQQGIFQGQVVQNQLMKLNERRQTAQMRPIRPYSDQPYVDDTQMTKGIMHTRAADLRTHRTMRPEIKAYVDAFYGHQNEDTTPIRSLTINKRFKIRETPTVTLNPNVDAYLDDIFELTKVTNLEPLDRQTMRQDMFWQPSQTTIRSNVKAYAGDVYPDIQMRAQVHMRAEDDNDEIFSFTNKPTTKNPSQNTATRDIVKDLDTANVRGQGQTENPDGISDEYMFAKVEGAGADRGPDWYDDDTSMASSDSKIADGGGDGSIDLSSSKDQKSSGASSKETSEKRLATRVYRECTPCPIDMIRKFRNMGIKWICAAYQRARRSFKSLCMMRYRNCQDGTMFVKIADHRCENSSRVTSYHGRSWFYVYKV